MKTFILAMSLLIYFCPHAFSGTTSSEDCYEVKLIKSWVELPQWIPAGDSFLEKMIFRSGDKIAFGIAHGFTKEELLDPERLQRVLALIKLSFSQPALIVQEYDRKPRVTLLLLYFLRQHCQDTKIQQQILEAEQYVSSQIKTDSH